MKVQTPSDPALFKPARAVSSAETAPGPAPASDKSRQSRLATSDKPTKKKLQRKARPSALEPTFKINLNCTLERRDAINAAAAALGLTTTAYLLYCEEKAIHQLVQRFTDYLETRARMDAEAFDARLKKIEEFLKLMSSPY